MSGSYQALLFPIPYNLFMVSIRERLVKIGKSNSEPAKEDPPTSRAALKEARGILTNFLQTRQLGNTEDNRLQTYYDRPSGTRLLVTAQRSVYPGGSNNINLYSPFTLVVAEPEERQPEIYSIAADPAQSYRIAISDGKRTHIGIDLAESQKLRDTLIRVLPAPQPIPHLGKLLTSL